MKEAKRQFWLNSSGVASGPHTVRQIHIKLASTEITWQTLACEVGDTRWTPLIDLPGIGPPLAAPISAYTVPALRPQITAIDGAPTPLFHPTPQAGLKVLPRLFNGLITADITVFFFVCTLGFLEQRAEWGGPQGAEPTVADILLGVLAIAIIVVAVAAWTGLLLRQNWGRWLWLVFVGFGHLFSLGASFYETSTRWHFPDALVSLSSTIDGLLLGLAFFSPLASEFGRAGRAKAN
ncbi:MAG: hypothetical protein WCL32_20490 [Planctomycetota bacterium]